MNNTQRKFKKLIFSYYRFGIKGVVTFFKSLQKRKSSIIFRYPRTLRYPIYLRRQTSDYNIFEDILITEHYAIDYKCDPKVIFDCGANIGIAAVYYANRFPEAKIICIEPESSNFEMLKKNTECYPNINILKAGLWYKKSHLKIDDDNRQKWSFTVSEVPEDTPNSIKAVSIPDLMREYHCNEIDILKIDIEGAEKELFEKDYDWLSKVNVIVIETHDSLREGCSHAFFRALINYNFSLSVKEENFICYLKNNLQ